MQASDIDRAVLFWTVLGQLVLPPVCCITHHYCSPYGDLMTNVPYHRTNIKIRAGKKSLCSHQLPRLIFKTTKEEPHSSSNTQSWETYEMHEFFW